MQVRLWPELPYMYINEYAEIAILWNIDFQCFTEPANTMKYMGAVVL